MPSLAPRLANVQAATQQYSKLSPTLLGNAPRQTGASVNPHAGATQYTATKVPGIVPNALGQSVQDFGQAISKSINIFNERQDDILAVEAKMEYNDFARSLFHGNADQPGYKSSEGVDGVQAHGEYTSSLTSKYRSIVDRLKPSVRAKAIVHMYDTMDRYTTKGANHKVAQVGVAETQAEYVRKRDIEADQDTMGATAWSDGTVRKYLMGIPDQKDRDSAAVGLVGNLVYNAYNRKLEDPDSASPAVDAYNASVEAAGAALAAVDAGGKTLLPAGSKTKLEHTLQGYRLKAEDWTKKNHNKLVKKQQSQYSLSAPSVISEFLRSGNTDMGMANLTLLRNAYSDDPAKASDEVSKAIVSSIDLTVAKSGLTEVDGKIGEAMSHIRAIENSAYYSKLEDLERYALTQYKNELPAKLYAEQEGRDRVASKSMLGYLATNSNKQIDPTELRFQPGTLDESKDNMLALVDAHNRSIAGVTLQDLPTRQSVMSHFGGKLALNQLTDNDLDVMASMVTEENPRLTIPEYNSIYEEYTKKKAAGYSTPQYQQTPGFLSTSKNIEAYYKKGVPLEGGIPQLDKDRGNVKEVNAATSEMNDKYYATINEFDMAAKKAALSGKVFDEKKWWLDRINDGAPVSKFSWSSIVPWYMDTVGPVVSAPARAALAMHPLNLVPKPYDAYSQFIFDITGE